MFSKGRVVIGLRAAALCFTIAMSPTAGIAQPFQDQEAEEINLAELRNEFARARDGEEAEGDPLSLEEQQLLAEEAALLKQVQNPETLHEITKSKPFTSTADSPKAAADIGRAENLASSSGGSGMVQENTQLQQTIAKLKAEIAKQGGTIDQQAALISSLQGDKESLTKAKSKAANLQKELERVKGQLILAETEVDRLSKIIETHNAYKLAKHSPQAKLFSADNDEATRSPLENAAARDMLVATVSVKKANLRTGPGTHNSPLMSVSEGTRLTVETRTGEWYRVIAPTGVRAWVSSDVVSFGPTRQARPTRTVNIKGYQSYREINGGIDGAALPQ